jgi:hypothetical protein
MQNTHPPKPSSAKGRKLFGLSEVRPCQAAARSMRKLRLCQSEDNVEARQEGGEEIKDADCN